MHALATINSPEVMFADWVYLWFELVGKNYNLWKYVYDRFGKYLSSVQDCTKTIKQKKTKDETKIIIFFFVLVANF